MRVGVYGGGGASGTGTGIRLCRVRRWRNEERVEEKGSFAPHGYVRVCVCVTVRQWFFFGFEVEAGAT